MAEQKKKKIVPRTVNDGQEQTHSDSQWLRNAWARFTIHVHVYFPALTALSAHSLRTLWRLFFYSCDAGETVRVARLRIFLRWPDAAHVAHIKHNEFYKYHIKHSVGLQAPLLCAFRQFFSRAHANTQRYYTQTHIVQGYLHLSSNLCTWNCLLFDKFITEIRIDGQSSERCRCRPPHRVSGTVDVHPSYARIFANAELDMTSMQNKMHIQRDTHAE